MLPKGRKLTLEWLEQRRLLAADISLVRYFDTWGGGTIKSTNPAGLTYHPGSGNLYIADSEINEMPEYFSGNNMFEVSVRGDVVHREIASSNSEPTGITYNEFDGFFYVTNDDTHSVYRYDSALNTPLAATDTQLAMPDADDPEGIASDPATGMLYVVDGRSGGMQVMAYDAELVFQYGFPIAGEMQDGEGIALDPASGNLFIVSAPDRGVFEYTREGVYVRKYDFSGISPSIQAPQGLVFAPTSFPDDDPSELALYIADGMVDNFADGRIFETRINRNGIFEGRVAASSDDAEEQPGGSVSTTSSDLELVHDRHNQTVGMRFTGLNIPQGASILNAYLQFHVDETSSAETALVIQGENIDNAPTFTTTAGDISARARTSAAVSWSAAAWSTVGEAGLDQRTPDLASVIQEIVNRPGWTVGNAVALILSGTGRRVAEAFDGKLGAAPLLRIEFSTGEQAVNQPPQVDAGPEQVVRLSEAGNLQGMVTDDGLPGAGLTTTWAPVSGPGTVVFADASSLQTTATFSVPGTYVLRLTADDGQLTSGDETTISVLDENQPPQVDAGSEQAVMLPDGANLAGVVTDDGLPGSSLTTGWSQVSGPGTTTFADASSLQTTATFSAPGTYVLRLTASDGELTSSGDVTVTVLEATVATQTVEARVAASSDDAEEQPGGRVSTTSSDLELVHDRHNQTVGVRFTGLGIPQGASILNAYLQFEADQTSSAETALVIQGENVDNAPTFTTTDGDISARVRTSAAVGWSPAAWSTRGEAGLDQRTPDLGSVIQEIVSRPGWTAGNAVALILTGTGSRVAEAFDGKLGAAPLLRIEFSTGEQAVNQPPQVDAGPEQAVMLPDGANLAGVVTDDGLPGSSLTTGWSQVSGSGSATFADPSSLQTTATFSSPGTYVLRLTASDGELTSSGDLTVTVLEATIATQTIETRVAASSDDAEERISGWITLDNADLELVRDGNDQTVGVRFVGLDIPQGVSILNAHVQFQVDETSSDETALVIHAENVDSAPTFTETDGSISTRPRTSVAVDWTPAAWNTVGEAGLDQRTPDLASVIQEIVNRPGWNAGNAIALIISGTGRRVAESYDGKASAAPLLHVEYVTSETPETVQSTSGDGGEGELNLQNQNNRTDVNDDGQVSPIDALLVVNRLNRGSGEGETSIASSKYYFDVNGDKIVSPVDALQVVNFLNRASSHGGEGEATPPIANGSSLTSSPIELDATDSFFGSLGNSAARPPRFGGTAGGNHAPLQDRPEGAGDEDEDDEERGDELLNLLAAARL